MVLAPAEIDGLNLICNEARLLSVTLDQDSASARISLQPVRAGDNDDQPVVIQLLSVGRVVSSLRRGRWNDKRAQVVPLTLPELTQLLQSCGQTIYGEVWDEPIKKHGHWLKRISFEWRGSGEAGLLHRLHLFHNPDNNHLDLLIWFDDLRILDDAGAELPLTDLAAEVDAWWYGMRSGAVPAGDHGIYLLAPGQFRPLWKRWLRLH